MVIMECEMKYEFLGYLVEEGVATIRLARPDRRNALDSKLKHELTIAFQQFASDPGARAGILTGDGTVFSAGGDIGEFTQLMGKTGPEVQHAARLTAEPHRVGMSLTKPLVAAVNGPALGSGFGLVALCHFAVAVEGATFGITPIRLGVVPLPVAPAVIRALGYRKAVQLALTGEVISAEAAQRIGLIDEVVATDQLMPRARALARMLAAQSPTVTHGILEAFPRLAGYDTEELFHQAALWMVPYYQTEDLREGTRAFLERRSPSWSGR